MTSAPTVGSQFISELLSNWVGPLTSIALLLIGPRLYGWLVTFVLDQQIKENQELNRNFGVEVRALAAFYADCAVVLSNWLVVSAMTIWNVVFLIEVKAVQLVLLTAWIVVFVRLGYLLHQLTTPQDLEVYLPGNGGGVKRYLLGEQVLITLQGLTIPLALAMLKIPAVATWTRAIWP